MNGIGWTVETEDGVDETVANAILATMFEESKADIYDCSYFVGVARLLEPAAAVGYYVAAFLVDSRKVAIRKYDTRDEAQEVAEKLQRKFRAKVSN